MADSVDRLIELQALLTDCGLKNTVTTLVAEAAEVGKTNKTIQEFLKLAISQNTQRSGNSSDSPRSRSSSEDSTSFKSAAEEQPAIASPQPKRRKTTPPKAKARSAAHPKRGEVANAPKTPFCRIKPEDVQYADERLKDNRYTSKGGIDGDFGFKAHKDLIVTRGKSFTKEKNKKKRGSYSGGKITMVSHSIKFT
ncbi:jun-like transcription factor [Coemansia sp. RSA 989]|nr:jun-like transcription factor [Coemansia sp. RSA 989]KAJ2630457.1 jun-like transcription factor [Coemansia sp. RSA 1290]KAJ2646083.1 jun-like transcription factor [Coemansia sp. RSA 1250]